MRIYKRQEDDNYKYTLRNLNLRSTKSTSENNIITVIPAGSKVQVLDAAEDWYEVIYNNQKGYVYNTYLSTTKYTWTDVLLRSFPTSESNPIGLVPSKSRVQVLKSNGDWDHVIYNDQEGYIFNYFLSDDGNPPGGYDFEYFNTDMVRFVNDNNIKSPTINLIVTNLSNKLTYVFKKSDNNQWELLYKWSCTVGKPETPTIKGTFYVTGRKPYFGSDSYRVKYATRIRGSYYYHSVLFNAQGTEIINDTLGEALSHGCIRLAVENAQWIYDNVLDTTTVIIN
ncbi:L,D-transpeptidase family protein [Intestinibacter bartlettii]|uniref:SH3 domain-containing protein n=1 Tax=Intestinibacter bartlettii TaxID=261299 RepID=A0ABS6DZC2_9FIRM|nr:SH3 domain-containing protein [Intestinibacter bartlettii]MBU5337196.1 SH3 domain-containing protein [Intestinibacter bartlettii]MDO5009873.1 SH3 domain-containing protein [Intestinibacter bartlettii]